MNIHFIAIGGSVMHQLAIALHRKSYTVTGSDDVIFDPARTNLLNYGLLPSQEGWFADRIHAGLDAVILGMHARKDNPELLRAQELGLPVYSYPAYIYEQAKAKKRVVVGGSHGKTTITSMIMHVLAYHDKKFDYLVGAKLENFDFSVKITADAPIMILEGDEYLSSPIHRTPKFHYYQADIAILSGIAWDHINVFPTYAIYLEQFKTYISSLASDACLIYNEEDAEVAALVAEAPPIETLAYRTPVYEASLDHWLIRFEGKSYPLQVFGHHNLQNMEAARLACAKLGVSGAAFYKAMQAFKGAARRLELLAKTSNCAIYKDFAHAPSKVKATTLAVRQRYPSRKLVACLELHTYSSLSKAFLPHYTHSLAAADEAIVYYNAHTFEIKRLEMLQTEEVAAAFDHPHLQIITDTDELKAVLKRITLDDTNLLLMSSGNYGGIEVDTFAGELLEVR